MKRLQKTKQAQRLSEQEQRDLGANISLSKSVLDFLEGYLKDRLETLDKSLDSLSGDIHSQLGARKEIRHLIWLLQDTTNEE